MDFREFVGGIEGRRRPWLFPPMVEKKAGKGPGYHTPHVGRPGKIGGSRPRSAAAEPKKARRLKSAQAGRDWAKKHKSSIAPEVSEEEMWTLYEYKEKSYYQLNRDLRATGASNVKNEEGDKMVPILDAAIAKGRLPEAVTLYRGVDADVFEDLDDWTGKTIKDPGYPSTSLVESTVKRLHKPELMLEIRAPAGVRALWLDTFGGEGILDEQEILLPRNSQFRIVSDSGPGKGRRLVMELVP